MSLRFETFVSLPLDMKKFCEDCQTLLLPAEHSAHSPHRTTGVTAAQLRRPSVLLRPLDNKKSNAQYLFTDRSALFLLDTLAGLGYRKVLCVGTPRWGLNPSLHWMFLMSHVGYVSESSLTALVVRVDIYYQLTFEEKDLIFLL